MVEPTMNRPNPYPGLLEEPFWEAVDQRNLSLQNCKSCGNVWYPPGPVCPECLSEDWQFKPVSGYGKVIAWTVFHRQYFPELPTPYTIVSVEIDEGPLLIGGYCETNSKNLEVGMRVKVSYEQATSKLKDSWTIYNWVPA